jgi:two-component system, OmpR family, sensor histidine kinase KdpD
MANVTARPDPEQLLRQVQAEEEFRKRGRLKIFLGYAPGVGKSFRMLDEGRRRKRRGEDVIVGGMQVGASPAIQEILRHMESIPPKVVEGVPVIDVNAILRRRPQVCLVDGLAYDNPPGSAHAKRWQDVEQLLASGISVIGSVNLQFIEELRDEVERITGREVSDTIPLSFVKMADEIEVVDAPPEMCREGGFMLRPEDSPSDNQQRLSELREKALLLAADVVDHQLETYLQQHGLEQVWGAKERIMVCVTPRLRASGMIESGRRNADRFQGELFVVYVSEPDLSPEDRSSLEAILSQARRLHADVRLLESEEPIHAIMEFARQHGITQIFIGHSSRERWWHRIWGSFVDHVIREAEGMDVRVFPN